MRKEFERAYLEAGLYLVGKVRRVVVRRRLATMSSKERAHYNWPIIRRLGDVERGLMGRLSSLSTKLSPRKPARTN